MPLFRSYPQATSLEDTDAFPLDRIGTGTMYVEFADMAAQIGGGGTSCITYVIDGGGSTITTGVKGDLYVPFACTIDDWTLLGDQSGSIVVNVWKDTLANYPPTNADKITASAPPTIASATHAHSATLTGWTTAIAAGDTLRFNVDSITTLTRVTIALKVTKT